MFNEIDENFDDVAIRTFKVGVPAKHDLRNFLTSLLEVCVSSWIVLMSTSRWRRTNSRWKGKLRLSLRIGGISGQTDIIIISPEETLLGNLGLMLLRCVRTYVFHMLRTYVVILCNWFILWQNALYLYLGRLRMCLTTSRNQVSRSSVETFKPVQEIKQGVQNH